MSKRKSSRNTPRKPTAGRPATSAAPRTDAQPDRLLSQASELAAVAGTAAAAEELDPTGERPDDAGTPLDVAEVDVGRLAAALVEARRAQELYDRAARAAEARAKAADDRFADAERTRTTLAEEAAELRQRWTVLTEREQALGDRELAIRARELDAEAGFREYGAQARRRLDAELAELTARLESEEREHRDRQGAERRRHREVLAADRVAVEQELADRRKRVEAESSELEQQWALLRADRRSVDLLHSELEERIEAARLAADARTARRIKELEFRLRTSDERLAAAVAELDHQRGLVQQQRRDLDLLGQHSPEAHAQRVQDLESTNQRLRDELARRPDEEDVAYLRRTAEEHRRCAQRVAELRLEQQRLLNEVQSSRVAVDEIRLLRDTQLAYQGVVNGYRATIDELHQRYDLLSKQAERETAFRGCDEMDRDQRVGTPRDLTEVPDPDLAVLADEVRRAMWHQDPKDRLAYSERDVRSFLGGLAMSRLHLLEGLSGIGKTSLPRAFARAIGAGHRVVEVQAGWRDRQDLLGHYNTFERRFHESAFLKALYEAQCPYYAEVPYFIVLDEMNLSHPEQYFADALSKLENPRGAAFDLLPSGTGRPPARLLTDEPDGEWRIALPENVWFIGTANNDETTVRFADKTYDRAFVLELPTQRPRIDEPALRSQPVVTLVGLQKAFTAARRSLRGEAGRVWRFIEGDLKELLAEECQLGWGSRLKRQIDAYVPVVCAAGGTVGEAADGLLATKVIHKIEHHYEITGEALGRVRDEVATSWKGQGLDGEPVQTVAVLDRAIRRRSRG
ncbi:hypothetical protein GCM10027280_19630 [Micromonospora polyrhachis]|uniref:AAA domain (Dynein-related subfamily) n=1 Tax=Micromonospora polyrhachis TaxID=1282883 RepID=A0A7W7SMN6_9ACTN|nr:hypothetical protein [Micromonospora polyrhachis]MBB4957057.1 hypothetical protein [Micromonospora polyrhachis]